MPSKRLALELVALVDFFVPLMKTLKTAWSSVSKMDKKKWFKEPVTEEMAEGYHKIIKTPMDLGTILKKVNAAASR